MSRRSPPARGRGLKHIDGVSREGARSPPARGRGSKLRDRGPVRRHGVSSPPRGGVDRNKGAERRMVVPDVAPRGGVDRNSLRDYLSMTGKVSSPRGGVDRNVIEVVPAPTAMPVAPARGRGSKHTPCTGWRHRHVAPRAGAWIETRYGRLGDRRSSVAPRGGVDRNLTARADVSGAVGVAPARGRGSKLQA